MLRMIGCCVAISLLASRASGQPTATSTPPACRSSTDGEHIQVASRRLSVEDIGGRNLPGPSGPSVVGDLRFEWGLLLLPADERFSAVTEMIGPLALAKTGAGCWFRWDLAWGPEGATSITNVRRAPDPRLSGITTGLKEPAGRPHIPGYQFVAADSAFSAKFQWLGLWRSTAGRPHTALIAFDGVRHRVLATVPLRLGAISTLPSPDTPALHVTTMSASAGVEPIAYLSLTWLPQR